MKQTIAQVSLDVMLAQSREDVLRSAGYDVRTFSSPDELALHCSLLKFDLLLIGHSLPPERRKQVKQIFRQSHPDTPVVQLIWKIEELGHGVDHGFDVHEGPERLLQFLSQVLDSRATKPYADSF